MVLINENQEVGEEGQDDIIADLDYLELKADDEVSRQVKQHSLVGKVAADKTIKVGPLRVILSKAWPVEESLEIHEMERNIFLFVFSAEKDKRKVLAQGPWSVMKNHLILKEWPSEATLEEIDFTTTEFWVQVLNVPFAYLTKENANKIASVFPELVKLDFEPEEKIRWTGVMRMKVAVRVEDPLKIGFNLRRKDKPTIWVKFKYERLPDFCYHCGRLGHVMRDCYYEHDGVKKGLFGSWLRAEQNLRNEDRRTLASGRQEKGKTVMVARAFHRTDKEVGSLSLGNETEKSAGGVNVGKKEKSTSDLSADKNTVMLLELEPREKTDALEPGRLEEGILGSSLQKGDFETENASLENIAEDVLLKEPAMSSHKGHGIKRGREGAEWEQEKKLKADLQAQIQSWAYEMQPGSWNVLQTGMVQDENLLNRAFGYGTQEEFSALFQKWEIQLKGKGGGNKRLLQIKRAARAKVRRERLRQDMESACEFREDRIRRIQKCYEYPNVKLVEMGEMEIPRDSERVVVADPEQPQGDK